MLAGEPVKTLAGHPFGVVLEELTEKKTGLGSICPEGVNPGRNKKHPCSGAQVSGFRGFVKLCLLYSGDGTGPVLGMVQGMYPGDVDGGVRPRVPVGNKNIRWALTPTHTCFHNWPKPSCLSNGGHRVPDEVVPKS